METLAKAVLEKTCRFVKISEEEVENHRACISNSEILTPNADRSPPSKTNSSSLQPGDGNRTECANRPTSNPPPVSQPPVPSQASASPPMLPGPCEPALPSHSSTSISSSVSHTPVPSQPSVSPPMPSGPMPEPSPPASHISDAGHEFVGSTSREPPGTCNIC